MKAFNLCLVLFGCMALSGEVSAQQALTAPDKSSEILKLLFENNVDEAAQTAADHLGSIVSSYLELDPEKRFAFQKELAFVQFISAYDLGESVREKLKSGSLINYAAACEMTGDNAEAAASYQKLIDQQPDHHGARKRLAFLLVDSDIAKARQVLSGVSPDAAALIAQHLNTEIASHSMFVPRLDYLELLLTCFEKFDPKKYVAADWLPALFDQRIGESHWPGDPADVRLAGLYENGSYMDSSMGDDQKKRSEIAIERREDLHKEFCETLMRLPQFADEGFKRLAAVETRDGENEELHATRALKLLKGQASPQRPEGMPDTVGTTFYEHWIPILTPAEYLFAYAARNNDAAYLRETVLPQLGDGSASGDVQFITDMAELLEASDDKFMEKAVTVVSNSYEGVQTGNLNRQIFSILQQRGIDEDRGPLIYAYLSQLDHAQYQSTAYVWDYAMEKRTESKKAFQFFLDAVAEAMLGPAEQQAKFIKEHHQPNRYDLQSPGNQVRNFSQFLQHMMQGLQLTAPCLAKAYELKLVHPQDYSIVNGVNNSLQSWNMSNEPALFYQFLKDSPFLNDVANFEVYPMTRLSQGNVVGFMLSAMRSLGSSDRKKITAQIETHKIDSFGKQLILAYADNASSSSSRSTAVAKVFEKHLAEIRKLPRSRQHDLYTTLRFAQSSSSRMHSSATSAAPQTAKWYQEMKSSGQQKPTLGRRMVHHTANVPSAEEFLKFGDRKTLERQFPLDFTVGQLLAETKSFEASEQVFIHYLKLSRQSSAVANRGNAARKPSIGIMLAQHLNSAANMEAIGFTVKMIDTAGDPQATGYQELAPGFQTILKSEDFEDADAIVKRFSAASGGKSHECLIGPCIERLAQLSSNTLRALIDYSNENTSNAFAMDLGDSARLVVAGENQDDDAAQTFVARLQDDSKALHRRLQLISAIAPRAIALESKALTAACIDLLRAAFEADEVDVGAAPAALLNAIANAPARPNRNDAAKALLELWANYANKTPFPLYLVIKAAGLAEEIGMPAAPLLANLPSTDGRQSGFLPLLVRHGAFEKAKDSLPWSFLAMPPIFATPRSNGRINRTIVDGRLVETLRGSNTKLSRPRLNMGPVLYTKALHDNLENFLKTVPDAGQRFVAKQLIVSLKDDAGLPDGVPDRDARLNDLAERYDSNAFASPYLAEHGLSWLCAAVGVKESYRSAVAQFGKSLNYSALTNWNHGSKAARMNLLNHFLADASIHQPAAFAVAVTRILDDSENSSRMRQLLETYCQGFPQNAFAGNTLPSPEESAAFLPLLRKVSKFSFNNSWSGRDQCINGNLVMHLLANKTDEYDAWLQSLDENVRANLERRVSLEQALGMISNALSSDRLRKERRMEIFDRLFAMKSIPSRESLTSINGVITAKNVFDKLQELNLLTKEEILKHGPRWAAMNPRDGAAFGDLAKLQAEAGMNEEAILNFLQGVGHCGDTNKRRYTTYHLRKAKLLLEMNRIESAMTWLEFLNPSQVDSSMRSEHAEIVKRTRMRYLADPARASSILAECEQALAVDAYNFKAWHRLADVLSANGSALCDDSDVTRGLALLKLALYIQNELTKADPDSSRDAVDQTRAALTKALEAVGEAIKKVLVVERGSKWDYRYPTDGFVGKNWTRKASGTDWKTGIAQLGYGDGDEETVLDFGSDSKNKPITAYFRKAIEVEDPGRYEELSLHILHDDGMICYVNGKEVARNNMPSGSITSTTLAVGSRSADEENEFWTTLISSPLQAGTNVIAVEVHQRDPDSSDLGFDFEMVSEGINIGRMIAEVEAPDFLASLGDWKDRLPEDLISSAKAIYVRDKERAKLRAN